MKPEETGLIEDLLNRRAQTATGAAAGGPLCGDPELLAAYAENSLGETECESFETHLASCAACREAVAGLVRMAPRDVVANPPVPVVSWWKGWFWIPALAGVLIVSVVLINRQPAAKEPDLISKLERAPEKRYESPPASPPPELDGRAPRVKAPERTTTAPAPIVKKAEADAVRDARNDPSESAARGGGRSRSAAAKDATLTADASALRKQEDLQIAPAAAPAVQVPVQSASSQMQNAPPPAPFVNNLQNTGAGAMGGNIQNTADATIGAPGSTANARMSRMAPAAKPASPATAGAGTAGAAFASKTKLIAPAKGRIEKGTLQISTDGGDTWRDLATPEPVSWCEVTDVLNIRIRTKSLAGFRTKDGGKTWEAEKTPQP